MMDLLHMDVADVFFLFLFLAMSRSMQDFSSLTRGQIHIHYIESVES